MIVSAQETTEPAPEPRPGPDRDALSLGPLDEIGHDQEVAGVAHRFDDAELEVQPFAIGRGCRCPLLLGVAAGQDMIGQPLLQPFGRPVAQLVDLRPAGLRYEMG